MALPAHAPCGPEEQEDERGGGGGEERLWRGSADMVRGNSGAGRRGSRDGHVVGGAMGEKCGVLLVVSESYLGKLPNRVTNGRGQV